MDITGEPNNSGGLPETDNANPSESDTPETWDYFDPEEDNEETPEAEGTEDEATETEAEDETEAPEEVETPEELPESEPVVASPDSVVQMDDGRETTVKDLILGNMLRADHTRKTQDLSNQRKALEAEAQKLQGITQAFVDHLSEMVPAEPDLALAHKDPQAYMQQKAQYDAAVGQVQKLIELGSQPKDVTNNLSQEDRKRILQEENAKLVLDFPEVGTKDGRAKFFNDIASTADEFGFSTDELRQVTDHRVFKLAHWAKKGMEADKAAKAAREKAQKAAPATPRKPGQPAKQANRNAEAMRKLSRSGSLNDALAVDFD